MKRNGTTNFLRRYTKNKQLGAWVSKQRHSYKLIEEGKPSTLTKERIDSLNKLGFVWQVGKRENPSQWDERLQQLVDFNNEFNHTNVPRNYAQNKPLGAWANTQRIQYKLNEKGKPSTLTNERINSLNKLGFVWRPGKGKMPWDERLQQLVDSNNEFNHTNVPQRYTINKPLGSWVNKQRNQYRLIEEGKPSLLTKERIESLNNLGFVWRLGQGKY